MSDLPSSRLARLGHTVDDLTSLGDTNNRLLLAAQAAQPQLRSRDKTLREQLDALLFGTERVGSVPESNFRAGLTGINPVTGEQSFGLADFTPAGLFMSGQEARQDFQRGDNVGGTLNALGAAPGLGNFIGAPAGVVRSALKSSKVAPTPSNVVNVDFRNPGFKPSPSTASSTDTKVLQGNFPQAGSQQGFAGDGLIDLNTPFGGQPKNIQNFVTELYNKEGLESSVTRLGGQHYVVDTFNSGGFISGFKNKKEAIDFAKLLDEQNKTKFLNRQGDEIIERFQSPSRRDKRMMKRFKIKGAREPVSNNITPFNF